MIVRQPGRWRAGEQGSGPGGSKEGARGGAERRGGAGRRWVGYVVRCVWWGERGGEQRGFGYGTWFAWLWALGMGGARGCRIGFTSLCDWKFLTLWCFAILPLVVLRMCETCAILSFFFCQNVSTFLAKLCEILKQNFAQSGKIVILVKVYQNCELINSNKYTIHIKK